MTPAPSIDRQRFLANLRQSGLVSDSDFASLAALQPSLTGGKPYAHLLIDRGVLTRFQAERLLAGRTTGFNLGPYRILDQLGQGGMGRVYKAEHRSMKRVVALKVLANNVLQTERAIQLFLHEVRAVAVLQHPNIVSAYDANEVDGKYYLVLEYVDGPNLDQLVRREGVLAVGRACDYIRQAAIALQFAHELGMVHRDIKPANILLQSRGAGTEQGLVKVSDFGLARLAAPVGVPGSESGPATIYTRDNTVMGTPDYLSPEQSRDLHQTDIRSDIYSLGCTLYFLLTGQVPFPGGNGVDKIIRHATETPAPISDFRGDVPEQVVAILNVMMAKRPDDRFSTPAELAMALDPFAVTQPPLAWPLKPPSGELVPVDRSTDELAALDATKAGAVGDNPNADGPSKIIVLPRRQEAGKSSPVVSVVTAVALVLLALIATLVLLVGRN
ncbi:MAG: serine/threonine-protein kinase [Gemmataceae bacterium]